MNYPYQNFQQNTPQFQNMNYVQQAIPYPYVDRMSQLQSMGVQSNQVNNINQMLTLGKVVESIDVVKTMDIPMDGSMYYFPKADGKEIYAKQWLPNGTTNVVVFKPELEDSKVESVIANQSDFEDFKIALGNIKSDLQMLNDKIDRFSKPTTNKSKRESNVDE